MSILLGVLVTVGGLATAVVGATAFSLRSSDAAGTGSRTCSSLFRSSGAGSLIGVMVLLGASRPRHQLNWGLINAASLLLFAFAVSGQLGALQVLSGHRAEGVYPLASETKFEGMTRVLRGA